MIKKLIALSIAISLFIPFTIYTAADNSLHWYLKRKGTSSPDFPPNSKEIMQYNSLFIDNKVDDDNKVIYLTFDAGYENGNVEKILDTLKKENVSAAFFLLDNIILKNTDLVIRMAEEGHLVCNHTKNHKNLSRSEESEIIENLKALEDIYRECTGRELDKYFRFPEGKYSIDALRHVNNLGYTTVFWSFAYEDWDNNKQPNTDKAIKKILDNTHNGAVMLFHPTSDTNAKILPTLIKEWKRMGYSFGTLNQLKEKNYNK